MIKEDPRYSKFSSSDRVRRKVFLSTVMKGLDNKYIPVLSRLSRVREKQNFLQVGEFWPFDVWVLSGYFVVTFFKIETSII